MMPFKKSDGGPWYWCPVGCGRAVRMLTPHKPQDGYVCEACKERFVSLLEVYN